MNFIQRKYYRFLVSFYRFISYEKGFVKAYYKLKSQRDLNLDNPTEFSEKLQWLKLNYYTEDYKQYADKYEVRKFIEEKVGKEYLVDLIDVFDDVEAIDIEKLPNKFVLKGTHGSGYNVIVKDKANLDWQKTKRVLSNYMKRNYYKEYFERVYKDIKPRIIAETYLDQLDSDDIIDYKFFCIHGEPQCVWVKTFDDGKYRNCYYNLDWQKMGPDKNETSYLSKDIPKPKNLEEMIDVAKKLSEDFIFIRVDLYDVGDQIYFGEITFFPWGGYKKLTLEYLNREYGDLMKLPTI